MGRDYTTLAAGNHSGSDFSADALVQQQLGRAVDDVVVELPHLAVAVARVERLRPGVERRHAQEEMAGGERGVALATGEQRRAGAAAPPGGARPPVRPGTATPTRPADRPAAKPHRSAPARATSRTHSGRWQAARQWSRPRPSVIQGSEAAIRRAAHSPSSPSAAAIWTATAAVTPSSSPGVSRVPSAASSARLASSRRRQHACASASRPRARRPHRRRRRPRLPRRRR